MSTFVFYDPKQSIRDRELQDAWARAHAARVSHRDSKRRGSALAKRKSPPQRLRVSKSTFTGRDDQTGVILHALKGNSDPFDSFGIVITPEINQFIVFVREVAIPSTYFNGVYRRMSSLDSRIPGSPIVLEKSKYISSPAAIRDWQQLTDSLQDECTALARLAGYASVMAQVVPDNRWARFASMKMQTRAITLLRQFIHEHQPTLEESLTTVLPHLYGLFRTECINNNVTGAAYHARMLRTIFEKGFFTPQLLIQTLYNDVDLALKHTHKTFLDVDDWCPKVVAGTLTTIRNALPIFKDPDQDFHPSISYPKLLRLWRQRYLFAVTIYERPFPAQRWSQRSLGDMAFIYMSITSFLEHGQLINLYVDLTNGEVLPQADPAERHLQAALIMALLYVARRNAHESIVGGVDIRDAAPQIMRQLKSSSITAWYACSCAQLTEYEAAFLWIFYVGTIEEKRRELSGRETSGWFATQLWTQAQTMGVENWSQMQCIAKQFLYTNIVDPDGSLWFDDLLVQHEWQSSENDSL